ncbi:GGDEF domain-containing protein [Sphingomonas sp. LT1P40]|uniref:GGDEF domain-containing protein n=1 Tax=Alteristakelama amylovorans TaxID=3096166 RepID=UPI002FCB1FA1
MVHKSKEIGSHRAAASSPFEDADDGVALQDRKHAKLRDEPARQSALDRHRVLDTPPEAGFEQLTSLVRTVLDVPISAVSLIDHDRQWFKSIQGLAATETPRDIAFCAHTIMTREPLVIADATRDPRFATNPLVVGDPGIRSYAGVPLSSRDGYNLGSLCAIDTRSRTFSDVQIGMLGEFAALAVNELELRTIAQRDYVTGAMTRRAFVDRVAREIERFDRHGHDLSLVAFDLDHFKRVNDQFGHPAGDRVLKGVANACAAILRPTDLFGRVGGEEFAICLPDTSLPKAIACAERIRSTVGQLTFKNDNLPRVTASFGISTLQRGEAYDDWFARADQAMYDAKRYGRDRCVAWAGNPLRVVGG